MTNAELIAKIKAEIERKRSYNQRNASPEGAGAFYEDERILSFLSTLESEKPMNQDGLEEELDRFIASGKSVTVDDYGTYKVSYHDFKKVARHFAEWQKAKDDRYIDTIYQQGIEKGKDEMREQLVSDDLEEAANEFANQDCVTFISRKKGFIAGAEWQKKQDDKELSDLLTIAHLQGADQMKEQMMKEAVEGEVMTNGFYPYEPRIVAPYPNCPYDFGDKVRIIVLPKEDEK